MMMVMIAAIIAIRRCRIFGKLINALLIVPNALMGLLTSTPILTGRNRP